MRKNRTNPWARTRGRITAFVQASGNIDTAMPPSKLGKRLLPALVVISSLLFVGGAYVAGKERGMDRVIAHDSAGRYLYAVSIAVSRHFYGLKGWTLYPAVWDALLANGFALDDAPLKRFGTTHPQNYANPELLDSAIAAASKLDIPKAARNVRGINFDDLGLSDVVRLSFVLFGPHVTGFYKTYFVLFGLSLAVLFAAGYERPRFLLAGLIGAATLFATLSSWNLFVPPGALQSVTNPRFMSTLGYVPAIHLLLLALANRPPRRFDYAAAAIQSLLLAFACFIRSSAVWMPFAVVIGHFCALGWRRRIRKRSTLPPLATKRQPARPDRFSHWPVLTMVAVFVAGQILVSLLLHPIYRQHDFIGRHAFWHSVYYSFQFHPDWNQKFLASHNNKTGDEQPFEAAKIYLERHPPANRSDYYLPDGTTKINTWEGLFRRVTFLMFWNHPRFAIETFVVYKPLIMAKDTGRFFATLSFDWFAIPLLALGLLAGAAASAYLLPAGDAALLFAIAFFAALSATPNAVTVVGSNVMADFLFSAMALVVAFALAAAGLLLRRSGRLRHVPWAQ